MKKLIFALLMILVSLPLYSQKQNPSSLPENIGTNNWGKEYWFSIPPCYTDESGGQPNFVKIFVTSPFQTLVTVENSSTGYMQARTTIPNDVIEFNITPVHGFPYLKTGRDSTVPETVFSSKGIHIYADYPMVVYVVIRYQATSDGFLAIPVSSLGKEYIVAGTQVDPMFTAVWNYKLPCITTITAAYDDTQVSYTLGGNPITRTAGGMVPGTTREWTLMRGDVLAVSSDGDGADLSGSKIVASKPIAVVTGNMCSNIPTGNQWCDYTVEMDIPTFTWGLNCHVGKIPKRKFSSIIKIFAKDSTTAISRNGIPIGTIQKGGGIEGEAFLTMRMTSDTMPHSVVISGDKPISVTLYNTGVQEDGYPLPSSDPFVMATTPLQQYQKDITFCTPGILGGQGFKENYVNLVYETDENNMMPDFFEFAGPVMGGEFQWTQLNTRFPGVDEIFTYDVYGKKYAVKMITLPGDGVYKIRSITPFAAYSFGYDWCDSYGYPTSAAFADQETNDIEPPVPTWTTNPDGDGAEGVVTEMPEDAENRSNFSMITLNPDRSSNVNFSYDAFIAGETRKVMWKVKVIDPEKDAMATIIFADRRGNDTSVTITLSAQEPESVKEMKNSDLVRINIQNNQLFIVLDENITDEFALTIFDLNGTQVYSKSSISANTSNKITVDIGNFANGTYLLNLVSQDKYITKKFLIQR